MNALLSIEVREHRHLIVNSYHLVYGFFDECKRRSKVKAWKLFTDYFNVLPLAAVISDRIFCVHGGLSPHLNSLDDIKRIERPLHIHHSGLETDLLWSDPAISLGFADNKSRGVSYVFGPDQIDEFLHNFDFDLV